MAIMTDNEVLQAPGPVRLVYGFRFIGLLVENCGPLGWYILDYFPLRDQRDQDLLSVVQALKSKGYGFSIRLKSELSRAQFSPRGATDPEAKTAMARIGRKGFAISSEIVAIRDREFLSFVDGPTRRSSRR